MNQPVCEGAGPGPAVFLPDGSARAYREWRARKLDERPDDLAELLVPIERPDRLAPEERARILAALRRCNMALYQLPEAGASKADLLARNRALGLQRLDGNLCSDEDNVTSLQVDDSGRKRYYIPYTNRRLVWHTDGYYNEPSRQIHAFALHCVRPAARGGESWLLDPDLVYIHLRDTDPRMVAALFHPRAMTIPPNIENGVEIRGARTGPVFSLLPDGRLHMRYSARTRNIEWRDDPATREAEACIRAYLDAGDSPAYHHRLMSGQGVICNNVLHARTGFEDDARAGGGRLLYRARYYDAIPVFEQNMTKVV